MDDDDDEIVNVIDFLMNGGVFGYYLLTYYLLLTINYYYTFKSTPYLTFHLPISPSQTSKEGSKAIPQPPETTLKGSTSQGYIHT